MKRIIIFSSILLVFLLGILSADRLILITDPPEGNVFGVRSNGATLHFAFQSDTQAVGAQHLLYITVNGPITANWIYDSQVIVPYDPIWLGWNFNFVIAPYSMLFGSAWVPGIQTGIPGDDILHPVFSIDIEWDYYGNMPTDTAEICINADYAGVYAYWLWTAPDGVSNLNPSFNYGTAENPNPWCIKVGPIYDCGDANGDGRVNVSDVVWIQNFIFKGGESPIPWSNGEVNCDGSVNVSDAVWIINYIFLGGPAPCEC